MRLILILMLVCGMAGVSFADPPFNEKYSYKDFADQSFKTVDASEFNNTTIIGSNFWQNDRPHSDIFPNGMTGVVFKRCNLDNVSVPLGNTIDAESCNVQTKIQNDNEYWIVDAQEKPIEPQEKERFEALGLSVAVQDIPPVKMTELLTNKKARELNEASIE